MSNLGLKPQGEVLGKHWGINAAIEKLWFQIILHKTSVWGSGYRVK